MKAMWFRGRYVWGVVGLAIVAMVAAGGTIADPGEKDHGYLGVYMQELTRELRKGLELDVKKGVLISGVQDESPAAVAGLEDGDVVIEFNGDTVKSPDDLRDMVMDVEPGTQVKILVIREGDKKTIDLIVGERPDDWNVFEFRHDGHDMKWFGGDDHGGYLKDFSFGDDHFSAITAFFRGPKLGVNATELNDGLASYFDTEEGILVLDVVDESVAEEAGIQPGDVIQKVNDEVISEVDDLRNAMQEFEEGDDFDVSIVRKGRKKTLKATMDEQSHQFKWSSSRPRVHMERLHNKIAPRVRMHFEGFDKDALHESLEELREEMKELKKEMKKLKEDT